MQRSIRALCAFAALASMPAHARAQTTPSNPFAVEENAVTRVSEHVYMIPCRTRPGVPNVVIVVGSRAALVFDTGMGPMNGRIVAREVERLTKSPKIYLSTTDMRPEHTTGVQALPAGTRWIVPEAQREEISRETMQYAERFRARNAELREALDGLVLPTPDVVFDREAALDLGGVTARLLWYGPTLTRGDTLVMVNEDSVLLSGNLVHSKAFLGMPPTIASVTNWLSGLDKVEALHPRIIVPNHGDIRDFSMIAAERDLLRQLQKRALELKAQGVPVKDAGATLLAEFKTKYSDWTDLEAVPNIVLRMFSEAQ